MRALYHGHQYHNEKLSVVLEYLMRKSLNGIGYTFRGENLSYQKALEFHTIAGEIELLKSEQMNKGKKK